MSQISYTPFRLANHGGWLGREPRSTGASADRMMDRFRSWALQVGDHDEGRRFEPPLTTLERDRIRASATPAEVSAAADSTDRVHHRYRPWVTAGRF